MRSPRTHKQHTYTHTPSRTTHKRAKVALYHRSICEAASDDALLELADWAHRKLLYLGGGAARRHADETAKGARCACAPACLRAQCLVAGTCLAANAQHISGC